MTQQRRVQTRRSDYPDQLAGQPLPSEPANSSPPASRGIDGPGPGADQAINEGVYIISVAARILDMHPQTLRKYERLGLIRPGRTLGMLRLYSTEDIRKLRLIRHLSDEMGLNLAGVEFTLATVQNLLTMQQRLAARLGPEAGEAVEEELDLLFHSLNLPVDH